MKPDQRKFKYLIISAIAIVLLLVISIPIRNYLSERYIKTGDALLVQKRFVSAKVEYKKAKILSNKFSPDAKIAKASQAEANIFSLEQDFKDNNSQDQLAGFKKAKSVPEDEVDAVKEAKEFMARNEYQLAIVCANTALEMDQNYKDAWVYLGLANLAGANDPEISKENRVSYKEKASKAFEKVKELDPSNETAKQFLANQN